MWGRDLAVRSVRRAARATFKVRHRARLSRPALEQVEGSWALVPVGVFNPAIYGSTPLFARWLLDHPEMLGRPAEVERARPRALELCCGSGLLAVTMARMGADVVASDINPDAVWASGVNARLNDVHDRLDVREGDLWEPLSGQRFDLIVSNPPWYSNRSPSTMWERAFYTGPGYKLLIDLVAGIDDHLAPGGTVLLGVTSQGMSMEPTLAAAAEHGFDGKLVARLPFLATMEYILIYALQRHADRVAPGPATP